jgi:hypothetical protein
MGCRCFAILGGGPFSMHYFHAVDYIPWIGSTIAECMVVGIMLRRNLVRGFPVFFGAIVFDLLREMAFPAVAYYSAHAYEYCYWLSIPIEYVLAFGVMWEAFRYALGADAKVPPKALGFFVLASIVLVGLAAFLVLYPDIPTSNLKGLVLTLDRSIELLRCGMLLFLWIFAARLGITWHHHVWGIVCGLGIYSAIGLLAAAVHAISNTISGDWLSRFLHFSYFATTIVWTVYLWRPEPERAPLTLKEISFINYAFDTYNKMMTEIWRLLDGSPR